MATLYIDFENGNDNYAGTSFALLAQGTNGRITTATFSSATATFPNDGSLIGQYLSIFNGTIYAVYNITAWVSATSLTIAAISGGTSLANQAVDRQYYIGGRWKNITTGATAVRTVPGDTIRMMGSPAPTSLGQNGVWTSQALQATKSITSSTNATPIAITSTAHGYSTGDTVVITGHNTNTNANGTWEITNTGANTFTLDGSVGTATGSGGSVRLRNNTRVKLTTAVTKGIALTGPWKFWTNANANVTVNGNQSDFKAHSISQSIAILATFTTGLAAYWALPSATDFSGYQQVSFWIRQTTGTIGAAGAIDLRLCSDAAGVTAVNTINIPNLAVTGRWMPVTVDLGTNLGSSIQSIALYVNTDNGAQTFLLDNIIACKASSAADSLTLTSLIGKNTTGETFWGIQSINGTRVMLDADTSQTPTSGALRGYYGTSGTVTTWKLETIKLGPTAGFVSPLQTIPESGTDSNPITFSGGWNRTDMSTQTLETWLDGLNGYGNAFLFSGILFASLSKVSVTRVSSAVDFRSNAAYNTVSVDNVIGSALISITSGAYFNTLTVGHIVGGGVSFGGLSNTTLNVLYGIFSGTSIGINAQTNAILTVNGSGSGSFVANNSSSGIAFGFPSRVTVNNLKMEANGSSSITGDYSDAPFGYLNNCLLGDSVEFNAPNSWLSIEYASQNHDQTAGNHKIFIDGGLISSATDQRHTASGISWKLQPTSTTLRTSRRPITLSLAKVACSANNLVTIKAWMRRDNAGLTMRLVCKGGQIAGVASDVVSALTTTNAWEEETITFTPTETGVVEITAEAWGGTTFSGWVDDMTISQA